MIAAAKKEKRKAISGGMIGIALTSFLTGITEPLEFSFMFLSPLLYFVHAVLTGLSMVVAFWLDIRHGFGFSAGFIDYALNYGIAQRPALLLVQGIVFGVIYFVVFYFLIVKLNLKTPGREDEDTIVEDSTQQSGGDKYQHMANHFIQDLGGKDNISSIDNCATRLRLQIKDMSRVDQKALSQHGAKGVMKPGNNNLQIIVGTQVEFVADAMRNSDQS
ncbi:glucose PTS transporter subunit EIIB, partial [Halobacillus sp. BBL2006]|uniref:glucose PTS transporter subunit EIIB n=1 Tax=Halobacillus sp. BBL2006 TaxID=1543706 RepID=UPI000542D133